MLVGDVGGTKTALAFAERDGNGGLRLSGYAELASARFDSLPALVERYLVHSGPAPRFAGEACLALAGPVRDGHGQLTNLSWSEVEAGALARELGLSRVRLLNDVCAAVCGALELRGEQLVTLQEAPVVASGVVSMVSPGTGLGQASLYRDGGAVRLLPSEGGHADFAPADELEAGLLEWLRGPAGGHVSWETVLGGDGIYHLYRFFKETRDTPPAPDSLVKALSEGDPNRAVSEAGCRGTDATAVEALERWVTIAGRQAGNVALATLPYGGLYLGGGSLPANLPIVRRCFMPAFLAKGRFEPLLQGIRVCLVLEERAPLIGAARYAEV